MSQDDASADLPLAPIRMGLMFGAAVFGVIALVAVVATSTRSVSSLMSAVVSASLLGWLTWVLSRHRQEVQRMNLSHVAGTGHRSSGQAFRRGLALAVVLAVIETLIVGLLAWLWAGTSSQAFSPASSSGRPSGSRSMPETSDAGKTEPASTCSHEQVQDS